MAGDELWTAPLQGQLDWRLVDDALSAHLPEGPRIEYRERFDPIGGRGSAKRFVDTVAAMANSGGGHILIGVHTTAQDLPDRWPTLAVDGLRPGTLHAAVRSYLEPPVPIEIAVARKGTEGDVVVVRVPDAVMKPIFVNDRGVLFRLGESNVHARPAQLAQWFGERSSAVAAVEGELYRAAPPLISVTRPLVEVAIGPHEPWPESAWGDEVDAALAAEVARAFGDVGVPQVTTDFLQLANRAPDGSVERWVWFKPNGVVFRLCELIPDADGRLSALVIAGQVLRAWQLADIAIPLILPGYDRAISLVASVGGVRDVGLRTDPPMTVRLQAVAAEVHRISYWQGVRLGLAWTAGDADKKFDVLVQLMRAMLRHFGYSPSAPSAQELAFFAHFGEAVPPAPRNGG